MSLVVLVLLGFSFAAANLWFAAARSTIPLELRGTVTRKEHLIEKTLGVDDVYIVTIGSSRSIQVDRLVFDALIQNQAANKVAWSRVLEIDGKKTALSWSSDFRGMLWAMPLAAMIFLLVGFMALDHRDRTDRSKYSNNGTNNQQGKH